nr:hypothetical protein B0A51_16160 [Rachicladosporium sp. CCFEE 5018]
MAAARVLSLPELLSLILPGLDTKTLLLAQRVNKQWKAVIEKRIGALKFNPLLIKEARKPCIGCPRNVTHSHALDSEDLDGTYLKSSPGLSSSPLKMYIVSSPQQACRRYHVLHFRDLAIEYECVAVNESQVFRHAILPKAYIDCEQDDEHSVNVKEALGAQGCFYQFMAANSVLSLPELLESILTHLDTRTLLLSQRVSKQWQAVITSSDELQCLLFFRQRPAVQRRTRQFNLLLLWAEDDTSTEALACDSCGEDHYHALDSGDLDGTFLDCDSYENGSSALKMYLVSSPRSRPVEYKIRNMHGNNLLPLYTADNDQ